MEVKALQFTNTLSPALYSFGRFKAFSAAQSLNTLLPILYKDGRSAEVKAPQPENELSSISCTSGAVSPSKDTAPLKAFSLTFVTPGMLTFLSFVKSANAPVGISQIVPCTLLVGLLFAAVPS